MPTTEIQEGNLWGSVFGPSLDNFEHLLDIGYRRLLPSANQPQGACHRDAANMVRNAR